MSEASGFDIVLDSVDKKTCLRCGSELSISGLAAFTSHDCPECNHPFTVPARLGNFLLLGQLGKGGMGGVVYLGKDETLDRNVAIKVMPSSLVTNDEVLATFKREAQAAARLNHSNIAHVYSFGQENGQPYIVMELLSGVSLDRMIEEQGPLEEGVVIRVGMQIADALRAADEGGLIHGDIKPENILFDERMNAKLVDFGIATFVNQASDQIWGTPYYISPEKLRRQRVDARSDIYCLGGTLYHALTGHPPFDGASPIEVVKARLIQDPIPLNEARPGINEELMAVVVRMLQREPSARYPTYVSLISDLKRVAKAFPEGMLSGSSAAKGKKMVIKAARKTGQMPAMSRSTGSGRAATVSGRAATGSGRAATGGDGVEGVPRAKRGKGAWRIVAALLVLAALGAAVAGVVLWVQATKELKKGVVDDRRAGLKAMEARARGEKAWMAVLQTESNAVRAAVAAQGWVGIVSQAVWIAVNEVVSLPPPEERPVVTSTVAGVASATNGAGSTNAVAATNAAGSAGVVASTNGGGGAVEPVVQAPPEEVVPPVEERGIKKMGRQALQAVRRVLDGADAVKRLRGQAEDGWTVLQGLSDPGVAAVRADALNEMASQAAAVFDKIKAAGQEAESLARKVESEKGKIEKKRAADEAARAVEAQQQSAALAAQQQEEALKQATDAEKGTVEAARLRCMTYVQQHAYKQGIGELEGLRAGIKTEGGLKALAVVVDRYKRMDGLRTSIIQNLNAKVYEFGWVQGTSPQDVLGADEKGVKLKTHAVPWADVTVRQYMQFINNVLSVRETSARILGEMNLAAAIYCLENAEGNEKAKEAAKGFGRRATSLTPSVKDDAVRLLPFEL